MYFVFKYTKKKTAIFIICLCIILQIIDFYPSMINKFNYEEKVYKIDEAWEQIINENDHIVYLSFVDESFDEMRTAYYKVADIAYKNNCTLNNFYFAREINNVYETTHKYIDQLKSGELQDNFIYLIRQQNDEIWWNQKLETLKIDGYIVIKAMGESA